MTSDAFHVVASPTMLLRIEIQSKATTLMPYSAPLQLLPIMILLSEKSRTLTKLAKQDPDEVRIVIPDVWLPEKMMFAENPYHP